MATKLTAEQAKRLSNLGIKATTEEDARKKLLKVLSENDLVDMEGEDTDMLLDLAESVSDAPEDDDATMEEAKAEETEDNDDNEEEITVEEMKEFLVESGEYSKKQLKGLSDEDIQEAYEALIKGEEEVEEEVEEAPKPTKKTAAAPAKKEVPAPKAKPAPAPKAKVEEKAAPKAKAKVEEKAAPAKRGTKLNPRDNEEDRKIVLKALGKIFPEKEFIYAWISTAGVTIKFKGNNSNRACVLVENLTERSGVITCNLFFLPFGKKKEILDEAGIDYETSWNNVPFIKGCELTEAVELIEQFETELKGSVETIDKKLGANRAKMEENLKGEKAAAAKKTVPAPAKKKTK